LSAKLEPGIEILDETETDPTGRMFRVRIKNRCHLSTRFRANLVEIDPLPQVPNFQLPVRLQIGDEQPRVDTGELAGNDTRLVEVFLFDEQGGFRIHGANFPMSIEMWPYVATITAYADQGPPVRKVFRLLVSDGKPLRLRAMAQPPQAAATNAGGASRPLARGFCMRAYRHFLYAAGCKKRRKKHGQVAKHVKA
jgi:hypothetical protein